MKKCKICGEEMKLIGDEYVCETCGRKEKFVEEQTKFNSLENPQENLLEKLERERVDLIKRCALSVCAVFNQDEEYISHGSGWISEGEYIITNAHVVEANEPSKEGTISEGLIYVEYSHLLPLAARTKQEMQVIYFDKDEDVAILKPKYNSIPMEIPLLKIQKEITQQGEKVFTIGNPLHYRFTYSEGAVANPCYKQRGNSKRKKSILQTTITLNSGNSGGAVFNTKGEVVGMATFAELTDDDQKEIEGFGFCVTGETIQEAIEKI